MSRVRQLRREDGTLVPFRERRLVEEILAALRSAGRSDRSLAEELASVVTLFLEKYHEGGVPSVRDLDDLLTRVLRETGHAAAARCYEELQRERKRLRESLTVRTTTEGGSGPRGGEEAIGSWDRGRLVQSLACRREIPDSLAEEIASAVEQRLIQSELRSVTSALVGELVECELFERGLEALAGSDPLYGLRRSQLREVVQGEEGRQALPDQAVAETVLARFALAEIHGEASGRAHREGRLHLYGLSEPFKVPRVELPASLLLPDVADRQLGNALLRLRLLLDSLRDHLSGEIVLPDLVSALAALPAVEADPQAAADLLLLALDWRDAYGRPRPPIPHLVLPLTAPGKGKTGIFPATLLEKLHHEPESGGSMLLTLALPPTAVTPDARVLEELLGLAAKRPGTFLSIPREETPKLQHPRRQLPVPLRLSLGRVAVNLPLAFLDVQGTDLGHALSCLEPVGSAALGALHERFWLQRSGRAQGLHGVVVRMGGPGSVQVAALGQEVDLEVWGLAQALELLVRRQIIREGERARAAARILGYLDYLLGEERDGVSFRVRLGGTVDRDVRRTFLEATEAWATRYAVPDVQEVLRSVSPERTTLPVVVPLFSRSNAPLIDAPFAERIAGGLTLPLAAFGEESPGRLIERLRHETRLGLVSLAPPRPGEDVFEFQEELF